MSHIMNSNATAHNNIPARERQECAMRQCAAQCLHDTMSGVRVDQVNVQCGNVHNERGESISGECIHFPFPFPLPPAMHSGISRPREQGAPAVLVVASAADLFSKIYFLSNFSETLG